MQTKSTKIEKRGRESRAENVYLCAQKASTDLADSSTIGAKSEGSSVRWSQALCQEGSWGQASKRLSPGAEKGWVR